MLFSKIKKAVLAGTLALTLALGGVCSMGAINVQAASYSPETAGRRVVGYMPSYRTYAIDSIDFSALTHCNLSFMTYANGTVSLGFSGSDVTKIVNKCHDNNVKAIIALGGWGGFINDGAFTTAQKRSSIVNQIMNYVDTYNLDGVDIDIELTDADIWNNFDAFISELSGRLKSKGKLLTMAVSPWFTDSIANSTYNYFDFLNLMTYDYSQNGGDVAPWSQIYDSINYFSVRGVSNDRMVIGVPFYGYDSAGTAYTYSQIIAMNPAAAGKDRYNGISYNGADTIKAKAEYAKGFGGIMIWEIAQDSFDQNSLLSIIKNEMSDGAGNNDDNHGGNEGVNNGGNNDTNNGENDDANNGDNNAGDNLGDRNVRYRLINRGSGLALDISGASLENGTNVQQWTINGTDAQAFEISQEADGSYVITSVMNGKSLDIKYWTWENGGNIQMWDNRGSDNQKWYINDAGNGYVYITSKYNGRCLEVEGASTDAGANVWQWDYLGNANQQWRLEVIE
ncbi:Chitinase, GH18 family [Butyrivibrio fibrisolvens]|uniref:chitinase n=1 Tax=Butyrivibrio fibrisolvens TaxID=831 RepID=A0A1H9QM53_BUTFI|nr:glycosyl hydrolase family 18 protein [Butyrivibrio fibrisolvens]SER61285.1 Chitinase, GH18 family [Butyrivibrio fibrisolvens]